MKDFIDNIYLCKICVNIDIDDGTNKEFYYKKFIRLSLVKKVRPIKNEKIVRYKDLTTGNIVRLGNYTYEREKEFIDDSFGLIPYNEIVVDNKSNNKKLSKKID